MRFFPQELYIMRLKDEVPGHQQLEWLRDMSKEACVESLKEMSGKDFGMDADLWEKWWRDERERQDIDPDF